MLNDSKTYIRTEDSTLLRLTAQMKKIRKTPKQMQDQNRTNTTNSVAQATDFSFIINDSIVYRDWETDRKSTRLNSSHITRPRMPSSA